MWCLERNIHITAQYLPGSQNIRNSRCGVSGGRQQDRLEAESSNICTNKPAVWPTGSGPICNPAFNSMPTLLQLVARSICRSHRCLSSELGSPQGLCQPSMELDRQNHISSSISTGKDCPGSSSLENATMVSDSPDHTDRLSQNHLSSSRNNNQSTSSSNGSSASRMAYLRKRYRDQQLSEEATDLMLNSWRSKTNRSYDSLFSKWSSWCTTRYSDPISGPINEVLNFLAKLYKDGYQYSSINSYRSAISSVHEKIDGYNIGQHPLVTRLIKGVFHVRPPLHAIPKPGVCSWC